MRTTGTDSGTLQRLKVTDEGYSKNCSLEIDSCVDSVLDRPGDRKASKARAGEPEGEKRNSCHSPSPVASGSDLRGPDISEDFW